MEVSVARLVSSVGSHGYLNIQLPVHTGPFRGGQFDRVYSKRASASKNSPAALDGGRER